MDIDPRDKSEWGIGRVNAFLRVRPRFAGDKGSCRAYLISGLAGSRRVGLHYVEST